MIIAKLGPGGTGKGRFSGIPINQLPFRCRADPHDAGPKNTGRPLPNRSIIPAWGPCPKAGCSGHNVGPQNLQAFGTGSTSVPRWSYDSGIAMAADRVG